MEEFFIVHYTISWSGRTFAKVLRNVFYDYKEAVKYKNTLPKTNKTLNYFVFDNEGFNEFVKEKTNILGTFAFGVEK